MAKTAIVSGAREATSSEPFKDFESGGCVGFLGKRDEDPLAAHRRLQLGRRALGDGLAVVDHGDPVR
jgi:hypothetical protein